MGEQERWSCSFLVEQGGATAGEVWQKDKCIDRFWQSALGNGFVILGEVKIQISHSQKRCVGELERDGKKNFGHSGFQNMGYWSSGICFPFFRVAAYLKFELLDGNEKEKNCFGCENKLFGGNPVGTGNSLSQRVVGARSLDAVSGKFHGVQF